MAFFPLFADLKGKKCIVVGGGKVASGKVETLLQFEAELTVISPEVGDPIMELCNQGRVNVLKKEYSQQDIKDAFLVVAATSSADVNERVFMDARKRNIMVNVVDNPAKCTFYFPSVVKRGDLTIGISTSGTFPALSKKIRQIVESIFGEEYTGILSLLASFRLKVRKSRLERGLREEILKRVIDEFYGNNNISCEALEKILKEHEEYIQRTLKNYDTELQDGGQC